jgi:ABC-type Mn2+/Zn2+ transport system permease subunit
MDHKRPLVNWMRVTVREAAWAPLSIIVFYGIALALHLFDLFPPLDLPSHLLGGVAITYFFRSAIKNSQSLVGDIPIPIQFIFAFTCTGTTIIFWEFYENLLDLFFDTHMVRGLEDTIMDMFLGLLGALVLTVFYRKR